MAVMLLALGLLVGSAFGHPQEASPYIKAGPVVQGVPQLPEDWAVLSYNGFVFDTRQGEPALPAGLKISSYQAGTTGYYLVTLRVPITEAVKGELTSSGAKILYFMPNNSFLVAMDEAAKARVQASPAVSWVGIFQPAYKIASWMKDVSGTRDVWVQLFQNEDVNAIASKLRVMGYKVSIEDAQMYKIMKVRMDVSSVGQVANLREVMWLEPWPKYITVNATAQWTTQTNFPNLRRLWDRGVRGQLEVVNTADTGINFNVGGGHDMFRDPAVPITADGDFPTHRKVIGYHTVTGAAFGDAAGGYYHGTHTAGTICGDDSAVGGTDPNRGMALKDKMYFMDIGDGSGTLWVPANLYTGLYQTPYNGNAGGAARISSHSWGSTAPGQYTANCSQTDQFMWDHKDMCIFFAAQNSGPGAGTVGPPGTSKDIVTAGASDNGKAAVGLAGFSSRGPCNDNRRKPTVCAPGVALWSANGAVTTGDQSMSGTSMATPCAASNGALVRCYFDRGFYPTGDSVPANRFPYVSAALVKAVLINSAMNDMSGYTIPDNNIGWGRVCLDNTLYFSGDSRKLAVWDDTTGLSTGQNKTDSVYVNTNAEPLKITMVYTDYYAAAGGSTINNLDLVVTSPGGAQTYLGNVFSGGWSTTGGTADALNPEECVYIKQPALGAWAIRINAPSVPSGTRQPYAIVVSGGLGPVGTQALSLRSNVVIDTLAGSNGNGNGRMDIGETVRFVDTLYNGSSLGVTGVTATLRTTDANVIIKDSTATFGTIASGGTGNNGATPFKLAAYGSPRTIMFTLHTNGTIPYTADFQFPVEVGLSAGEVVKVIIPPLYSDSSFIYGLAWDGTNLWASTFDQGHTSRLFKINPSTGDTLAGGWQIAATDSLTDLAWDWGGNLLWSHNYHGKIVRVLNTNTKTIVRQFNSQATTYPIGLELRGGGRLPGPAQDTVWETDRDAANHMFKCDTLGNLVSTLTLPAYLNPTYGPRCLAYEAHGGVAPHIYWAGGTLLFTVTDFSGSGGTFVAAHLYEIRQNAAAMESLPWNLTSSTHHYVLPWNIRAVENDTSDWNYWLSAAESGGLSYIYKVKGFYDKPLPPSGIQTGISNLPATFALGQSYPNPMVGGATIRYQIPRDVEVSLKVYNVSGQLVKTLVSGTEKAGFKQVAWDGRSDAGHRVSAGIYFYRLHAGDFTATKKLVVVR